MKFLSEFLEEEKVHVEFLELGQHIGLLLLCLWTVRNDGAIDAVDCQ